MSKLTEILDKRNAAINITTKDIADALEQLRKQTEIKPLETPKQETQPSAEESSVVQGQETKPEG